MAIVSGHPLRHNLYKVEAYPEQMVVPEQRYHSFKNNLGASNLPTGTRRLPYQLLTERQLCGL